MESIIKFTTFSFENFVFTFCNNLLCQRFLFFSLLFSFSSWSFLLVFQVIFTSIDLSFHQYILDCQVSRLLIILQMDLELLSQSWFTQNFMSTTDLQFLRSFYGILMALWLESWEVLIFSLFYCRWKNFIQPMRLKLDLVIAVASHFYDSEVHILLASLKCHFLFFLASPKVQHLWGFLQPQ